MKLAALFLLALVFQTCSQPVSQSKVADCNLPSPSSDTAQFADFKQHMQMLKTPEPFIPNSDTMYCFQGQEGWGGFDYLCSVYRDSTGYKATFSKMTNFGHRGNVIFKEQTKPIEPLIWKQVQYAFKAQDFWCRPYTFDCIKVDGVKYYLWARENKKFRLVNWDGCGMNLDPFISLGKNLWVL